MTLLFIDIDPIFMILTGYEKMHLSMCDNFDQIRLLTTELAALECLRNECINIFSVATD